METLPTVMQWHKRDQVVERGLRFIVMDRHVTQGTRNAQGAQADERLWTVIGACSLQGRSAFELILTTVKAYFHRAPASSLLPGATWRAIPTAILLLLLVLLPHTFSKQIPVPSPVNTPVNGYASFSFRYGRFAEPRGKASSPSEAQWPQFAYDEANTGQSLYKGPQTNKLKWQFTLPGWGGSVIIGAGAPPMWAQTLASSLL